MDGISAAGGAGILQITMLKKQMDMAQAQSAMLLQALPQAQYVHPGKVDVYA